MTTLLLEMIKNNINSTVSGYLDIVSNLYNINKKDTDDNSYNKNELYELWIKYTEKVEEKVEEGGKCKYLFYKGSKEGQLCNRKTDSTLCKTHTNVTVKEHKEKKRTLPNIENRTPERVLKLNKEINRWWHPETGFVFKSCTEKKVVGVYKNEYYTENLCEENIAECIRYGFALEIKPKKIEEKLEEKIVEEEKIVDEENVEKKKKKKKKITGEEDKNVEEGNVVKKKKKKKITVVKNIGEEEEKKKITVVGEENVNKNIVEEEEKKKITGEKKKRKSENSDEEEDDNIKKKKKKIDMNEINNCAKNIEEVIGGMFNSSEDDLDLEEEM